MDWQISEPYSPYDYARQKAPYPAYHSWDKLTDAERDAVYAYQDLGSKQHAWDVKAPDEIHRTCSILNSYLRFHEFADMMSASDLRQCENLISLLDSAVSKSVIPMRLNLIRGLANSEWVSGFSEDDIYTEDGYGSYSLSIDAACRYARVNSDGKMVFLVRPLEIDDRALYLGDKGKKCLLNEGVNTRLMRLVM